MFSRPKILFLVSLLFVALLNPKFNPYLLFKFLIFYHSSIFNKNVSKTASLESAVAVEVKEPKIQVGQGYTQSDTQD